MDIKINALSDTGAMKSVMSFDTYQKLKLNELNTASILHVVEASGESLGARCEVKINDRTFFQTFMILARDFSIQNCIGISWTKANTHPPINTKQCSLCRN